MGKKSQYELGVIGQMDRLKAEIDSLIAEMENIKDRVEAKKSTLVTLEYIHKSAQGKNGNEKDN